jgi:hypothetical protein
MASKALKEAKRKAEAARQAYFKAQDALEEAKSIVGQKNTAMNNAMALYERLGREAETLAESEGSHV